MICLGFSITRRDRASWECRNKGGELFGNGKYEFIAKFSATLVTTGSVCLLERATSRTISFCISSRSNPLFNGKKDGAEGRDEKCDGRNEKCKFLARESVNLGKIGKRDCAWGFDRAIHTTWENLQIEKHKSGRRSSRSPDWFVIFDLQSFLGGITERSLTHDLFFPISNSFWH